MEHIRAEGNVQSAVAGIAANDQRTEGLVHVLFDSFLQSAVAGTRSTLPGPLSIREIVYRAEPYQIDIQVEAQPERNRVIVIGQLLDVSQAEMVALDVEITLANLRGSVVRTRTNRFGEFRCEIEDSGDLELSFLGLGGKPIVILLRGALKPSPGPKQ